MTVNTVSPAIISRAEFNRNAGQTKTPQLVRMDFGNLVTNGGFDTDTTGWTAVTATLTVDTNRLKITNIGAVFGVAYQAFTTVVGKTYVLSVDRTDGTAGGLVYVGTSAQGSQLVAGSLIGTGSHTYTFTATTTTSYVSLFNTNATDGTGFYDNTTIYEADPSDDAPWLRLPYGYKVGTRGMIVRDGVILHPSDYTEITDLSLIHI